MSVAMQPSELEIQREVEALRDIRRRSTTQGGPGSLILDPDLPTTSPKAAPPTGYWTPSPDDASSSSHEDSSENGADAVDDPFHLFWVPARLHPEIAPAEFRAFLKEHAHAPADGQAPLERSNSFNSSGLDRKKSMLSRQYQPKPNDGIEDEHVVPIRRTRTSIYANPGPQLTINDLQKLEELAEEASESDDPSRLRSVLRRSLSLNMAPSVIDQMDDMPDVGDEDDAPIIVPRPGQILRRAARTKIRKPGTGEGAHRFTARTRRKSITAQATTLEPRTSSDMSASDHGEPESSRPRADSGSFEPPSTMRPESYSEETSIYDAYALDETEEVEPPLLVTTPDSTDQLRSVSPPLPLTAPSTAAEDEPSTAAPGPVLHHPQPKRLLSPPIPELFEETRTPSPESTSTSELSDTSSQPSRPSLQEPRTSLQEASSYQPAPPHSSEHRKEKDKKGLFKWGGSDKNSKKGNNREREKEKESGFFGSLFGSKKKQDEVPQPVSMGSGRETAAALLGASKSSKSYVPSPSPQLAGPYARYPIHVERAIYRLSHIKLANPRRPLYEQVLISNLMFWYLGVINKTQTSGQTTPPTAADKERTEKEQKEKEERERAEKERAEKSRDEPKREPRRTSLTKTLSPGTPGTRKAEMAVRGPQYEMQHRVMEQEYGYGQPSNTVNRTSSAPPNLGYASAPSHRPQQAQAQYATSQATQSQSQPSSNRSYHAKSTSLQNPQHFTGANPSQLPPGAMPPVSADQTWVTQTAQLTVMSQTTSLSLSSSSSSQTPTAQQPSPRRAKSPPPSRYTAAQEKQPVARLTGRSLSASAAPPVPHLPPVNGKIRKGSSAHAVVGNHRHRVSEEEDVPLSVYQQRRK